MFELLSDFYQQVRVHEDFKHSSIWRLALPVLYYNKNNSINSKYFSFSNTTETVWLKALRDWAF